MPAFKSYTVRTVIETTVRTSEGYAKAQELGVAVITGQETPGAIYNEYQTHLGTVDPPLVLEVRCVDNDNVRDSALKGSPL